MLLLFQKDIWWKIRHFLIHILKCWIHNIFVFFQNISSTWRKSLSNTLMWIHGGLPVNCELFIVYYVFWNAHSEMWIYIIVKCETLFTPALVSLSHRLLGRQNLSFSIPQEGYFYSRFARKISWVFSVVQKAVLFLRNNY